MHSSSDEIVAKSDEGRKSLTVLTLVRLLRVSHLFGLIAFDIVRLAVVNDLTMGVLGHFFWHVVINVVRQETSIQERFAKERSVEVERINPALINEFLCKGFLPVHMFQKDKW